MHWWRQLWDISFSLSSLLAALLIGVALGNLVWGIPLDRNHEFIGTFISLLHPYALLLGLTTIALFLMHGAIYVVLKTEGELQQKAKRWTQNGIIFFILTYVTTTMSTLLYVPHMADPFRQHPLFLGIPLITLLAVANIPREVVRGKLFRAFLSSCVAMISLMALFGVGLYPHLVVSNPQPEWSLTIHNAASSAKTLKIMLVMVILGIPLVLAYTVSIYWIFRGKVKLEEGSY